MSTWREFTDYSPGARLAPRTRRQAARRAGLASGRKRRQKAWARRGNAGRHEPQLPLHYEPRQPSRSEFDARYEKLWPRPERPAAAASWERGRETVWQHVLASWRLVCAQGQHCRTTKPQRARSLAKRGRPRCERTVRRLNVKLEALGLAGFAHWRAPKGRRDCLVLEWRMSRKLPMLDVTPPSGTENPGLRPGGSPPFPPESPPPEAAENVDRAPPDPPHVDRSTVHGAMGITDEEEAERRRRFEAMWAEARQSVRANPPSEPPRAPRPGSGDADSAP